MTNLLVILKKVKILFGGYFGIFAYDDTSDVKARLKYLPKLQMRKLEMILRQRICDRPKQLVDRDM